jgi:hypothetical protein
MAVSLDLLRPRDLDGAARLLGEHEESGRGVEAAREWLEELLRDPAVLVVVGRERGAVVGIALASSTDWSGRSAGEACELYVEPDKRGLEPRLRESVELLLWAESLLRRAA